MKKHLPQVHRAVRRGLMVSALFLCGRESLAQDSKEPQVRLRDAVLQPAPNARQWLDSLAQRGNPAPVQVLVQFASLPDAAQRRRLETAGLQLLDYLPDNAYTAVLSAGSQIAALQSAGIRSIQPVNPAWKLGAGLAGLAGDRPVALTVSLIPGVSEAALREKAASLEGSLTAGTMESLGLYELQLPASKVALLAAWYAVRSIDRAGETEPLNRQSQGATKANLAHLPMAAGGYGLMGEGMTIGIGDQSSGYNHADLRDRVVNFVATGYANHGMHISGITGGAGNLDPMAEGFAPRARLLNHYYSNILGYTAQLHADYNMTVTNNSYGNEQATDCAAHGVYNATSAAVDALANQFPDILHVFAGGNSGTVTCAPYPAGYGTIYGSFQTGKNNIVVANVDKRYFRANDNARGPARDGRLKPEISAIGSEVYSTRGTDLYLSSGGTSMAAPMVSGSASLLQQRYKQLYAGAIPQAVLTKALLIGGTTDLGNPGPDYTYGFGSMNVYRSLQMMDAAHFVYDSLGNGGQKTATVNVPAGTAQLKVTLCWFDAPASPLAQTQLVNDLDLTVVTPGSTTRYPLILNPAPANVADPATEGADHLNNTEQIVIDAPAAGNYTLTVSGHQVTTASQRYALVYDFVPDSVRITYPAATEAVRTGDSLRIYFDAPPGTNDFTMELSTDNGASYTVLSAAIPAGRRYFNYLVPASINAPQCRLRLSRNGTAQTFTSGAFPINNEPVVTLDAAQCPGSMAISWSAVPNATGYQVLRKKGPFMQIEASTAATSYVLHGLSQDSLYYMAVRPVFNTIEGFRSKAVSRRPSDGNCANSATDNDLTVTALVAPLTGRQATSTAPGAAVNPVVRVRNLDDAAIASFRVDYSLNGGPWQGQSFGPIAGNTAADLTLSASTVNVGSPGSYTFRIAVTNLSAPDPRSLNDSLTATVRHLANAPLNLTTALTEDFESLPAGLVLQRDSLGITPNDRWDFANSSDSGRLRSFITSDIVIGGTRSVSLDAEQNGPQLSNALTGTLNLSNYSAATTELRADFRYKIHGRPKSGDSNRVWFRGADTQPWVPIYQYGLNASPGLLQQSGSLSLTDAANASGQPFTASAQLRFVQRDTSLIAANDYGNGLTLDDIRVYTVSNDAAVLSILTPTGASCNLGSAEPLTVRFYNGMSVAMNNVPVGFRLDGGAVQTAIIPAIPAKDSVDFTFPQSLNAAASGPHSLSVWVAQPGDSYPGNDNLLNVIFRNQPLVSSYPYLQDFEGGDGYFYAEGTRSSWAYGTPSSGFIHKAASGTRAWKTGLTGSYNDLEQSYLYSPCFDISGLSNPMLSFSLALDIEDCGATLCDGAWVEYSTNGGASWSKLGAQGQGTNWYNSAAHQLWSVQNRGWRVASIALPASTQPMRFRFVFNADPASGREGMAIDDIHVYDRALPIFDGGTAGPVSATPAANAYTSFLNGGKYLAQLDPGASNTGLTEVSVFAQPSMINVPSQQYFLPRSFLINSSAAPADSVTLRLFVLESEVQALLGATGCATCSKPEDVYEMGVTQYDGPNENGSLDDNSVSGYIYHPYAKVRWVPYDNGYYAQLKVAGFSEFWFNDGGATNTFPLPIASIDFSARKISETTAQLQWTSRVDTYVTRYEVQRSFDASTFSTINVTLPQGAAERSYIVYDTPALNGSTSVYYRLRYTDPAGRELYSPTRRVDWTRGNTIAAVYPNPVGSDRRLTVDWSAAAGEVLAVHLTDINGRTVYRASATGAGWSNTTVLELDAAAPGVYFLRCILGGTTETKKIILR